MIFVDTQCVIVQEREFYVVAAIIKDCFRINFIKLLVEIFPKFVDKNIEKTN